ncbi:SMI1/KNR4 family protein [Streptomyces sp. EN23]|uniref:SMI1/KNR4 family protein n=1 Tax=Streptomyces sp. EN23 TaxID=212774 RepID=UPI00351FCEBC
MVGPACPDRLAELAPPASPQAIDQLEVALNVRLPTDLRASLLCHDGDSSYRGGLRTAPPAPRTNSGHPATTLAEQSNGPRPPRPSASPIDLGG